MAQALVRFLASQYVERFVEGDGIERPTSPPSRVQPVSLARASAAATTPVATRSFERGGAPASRARSLGRSRTKGVVLIDAERYSDETCGRR